MINKESFKESCQDTMKKLTVLKQIFAQIQNRQWGVEKPVIHMMPTMNGAVCTLYFVEQLAALEAADDLSNGPISLANIGEIDFEIELTHRDFVNETNWLVTLTFNNGDLLK